MIAGEVPVWPGLTYGETERLLGAMQGIAPEAIRTRFRKLRLRPFPDEIRSGIGSRVVYDLPRVLALATVFELNRLFVPQGHAMELTQRNWPEWARAFTAAAVKLELMARPTAMPGDASPIVQIRPDAYIDEFGPCVPTGEPGAARHHQGIELFPALSVYAGRTVAALAAVPGTNRIQLGEAFRQLELSFGWTLPETPHRSSVASVTQGRGFLDEGPYFERAVELLQAEPADFAEDKRSTRRASLVALLRYLEEPAPIDRWKAEVGDDECKPRLGHLLNFWARANGLPVARSYPSTLEGVDHRNVQHLALAYVERARRSIDR